MSGIQSTVSRGLCVLVLAVAAVLPAGAAEQDARPVTFTRDIAPILQRSCQTCHRPDSIAPMSLLTFDQVRPFAKAIRQQTARRQMPPWYIEKNIGIQGFLADPSLSDAEIAMIGRWVDADAPEGNPADMPAPKTFADPREWALGKPDLIVSSLEVIVDATQPDWWGQLGSTATGLTEDRYIASSEIREVNDIPSGKSTRTTVGGLNVFHHASVTIIPPPGVERDPSSSLPAHEVGRNGDIFDPDAGRMLKAGSSISFNNSHLHANGRKTKARLEVGLRFHPKGYKPKIDFRAIFFGTTEIDLPGNTANQRIEAYYTLPENGRIMNFEPHMHAPATRMCFEAIYGPTVQTLNCAGYNHSWVRNYQYDPDSAPLLPKGTILRVIGWFDTTPANRRLVDSRNWTGGGNRSVDNMFISLSHMSVLSDQQFKEEVAKREQRIREGKGDLIGCITCGIGKTTLVGQTTSAND